MNQLFGIRSLQRVEAIESETIAIRREEKLHKSVSSAARLLKNAAVDEQGRLRPPINEPCVHLRVSKANLDRALMFLNALILSLEQEGFPVTVKMGTDGTYTEILGEQVTFALVERSRVKSKREVREYSWTRTITEYEPTGNLEFRITGFGDGYQKTWSEGPTQKLETLLAKCIGSLMRRGLYLRDRTERFRLERIEEEKRRQELAKLAEQIEDEEKKVKALKRWVTRWSRANTIREFVTALEKVWTAEGHDISPDAPKGQRLAWMRQQADRFKIRWLRVRPQY